MKYILLCQICYLEWFIIPWYISQNRYTWMADKTATRDAHKWKETFHIYLYLPRALSFVGCRQGSILTKNGGEESESTITEDQSLLHWPPGSPDLSHAIFFLWVCVKGSFYSIYRLSCEDGSSLPSQKSFLTCCSGYGPNGLPASRLPCHKWRTHEALVTYAKKMESFSFYLQIACYNPFCRSRAPILWNVSGNYE